MPRFKSISFYYNRPNIKLFLQKYKNFRVLGLRPQTLSGLRRTEAELPGPFPLLQISGHALDTKRVMLILSSFRILQ